MNDETRIGDLEERIKTLEEKMQNLVGWIESTGGIVDEHTDRIQALEIKRKSFEARTRGWEKGFGSTVRESLKLMEARIDRLLVSDDSATFDVGHWVEELKKMKGQIKRIDATVFDLLDRVPPRPKGVLSRYLEESIKQGVCRD